MTLSALDATRSCRSKHRYGSETEANEVAAQAYQRRGHWLRVYLCDAATGGCGGYHLTHRGALPPANANWRPPAKSQRQIAWEQKRRGEKPRRRRRG